MHLSSSDTDLGVVAGADQNVDLDRDSALALPCLLQLTDLTAQDLESLIHMEAMQVQQYHTCSQKKDSQSKSSCALLMNGHLKAAGEVDVTLPAACTCAAVCMYTEKCGVLFCGLWL